MISALVSILILCLVLGIAYWIFTLMPLPQPFKQVGMVALLLIFLLIVLGVLLGHWRLPLNLN